MRVVHASRQPRERHRRRAYRARRRWNVPAATLAGLVTLLAWSLLSPLWLAISRAAAPFPPTDVVLVVDVSAGMALPTELPADFPNRERYRGEIAQLLELFNSRESAASGSVTPTTPPSLTDRAKTVVETSRWLAELAAFQRDVERYTENREIDADSLTRLTSEKQAVRRTLDVLSAASQADGTSSRVGLVAYSSGIVTSVPLSNNQRTVREVIDKLSTSSDSADVAIGLQRAINLFPRGATPGSGKRQIILLSGSPATQSAQLDAAVAAAGQQNIAIDTVGVGPSAATVGQETLVSVARQTGGGYIFAPERDVVAAATVGFRAYATSNVVSRTMGSAERGKAVRETVTVPPNANSLRVTVSNLREDDTARATTALPTADRARATAALPTTPTSPRELQLVLVDPDGVRHPVPEGTPNGVVSGPETIITIAAPRPGPWQVELGVAPSAPASVVPYAMTGAVDGTSAQRPLDLAPPGAGDAPPPPGKLAGDRRVQVALWFATLVVAILTIVLLVLTVRGLTRPRASTPLGCAFGCLIPVLLGLLALAWAVVRFYDLFRAFLPF